MPIVPINSLVSEVKELETIPIQIGQNPTVYLRDVATVHDASDIPAGYALVNGRRAVYILVTKRADASTLSVVRNVKERTAQDAGRPARRHQGQLRVRPVTDGHQRRAQPGRRGRLRRLLTGLMVLVFLRDWRSVIVVVLNIPFAICGALVALWLTGQTINLMTLGGLALSIGILVDEATVEIENIHHKMDGTRSVATAVRLGNMDTAVPRLLAMLCILAVFVPSFFMQGAAQALFVPLCAGGRVRDGLVVPALEHVRAGPLDVAACSNDSSASTATASRRRSIDCRHPMGERSARVVRLALGGRAGVLPSGGCRDRRRRRARSVSRSFPRSTPADFSSGCVHRRAPGSKKPSGLPSRS